MHRHVISKGKGRLWHLAAYEFEKLFDLTIEFQNRYFVIIDGIFKSFMSEQMQEIINLRDKDGDV